MHIQEILEGLEKIQNDLEQSASELRTVYRATKNEKISSIIAKIEPLVNKNHLYCIQNIIEEIKEKETSEE